jgi:hypothetical protein
MGGVMSDYNPMQAFVDSMSAQWQKQRSESAEIMNLGEVIEKLKQCNPDKPVLIDTGEKPRSFQSYRGYYSDLAIDFDEEEKETTVAELLQMAEAANGETFTGYKGGDFTMSRSTPVWVSEYGTTGKMLAGIEEGDVAVILMTKEDSL